MGIIDNFKDLFKVADAVNNSELYKKLAEIQRDFFALQEENNQLKQELCQRDERQNIAGRLRVQDNAYYLENDGPYCMRCWDVDSKLVREKLGATRGTHFCVECAHRR